MNPDSENFDSLRRLLALKRHEQPPPGYFDRFPSQVLARIRAGEKGEPAALIDRLFGEAIWWQRVRAALEARPAFAGAFGAAGCALVISGIVYSENTSGPGATGLMANDNTAYFATAAVAMNDAFEQASMLASSTNPVPVVAPGGSLFDQVGLPSAVPVNYTLPVRH
jgi:hypothetical protein